MGYLVKLSIEKAYHRIYGSGDRKPSTMGPTGTGVGTWD